MILPSLLTWVEQHGDRSGVRVDAGEIWTFVEVTVDTGETEVIFVVGAAVLAWANVLDVERSQRGVSLAQLAVFTPAISASAHQGFCHLGHEAASARMACA